MNHSKLAEELLLGKKCNDCMHKNRHRCSGNRMCEKFSDRTIYNNEAYHDDEVESNVSEEWVKKMAIKCKGTFDRVVSEDRTEIVD